MLNVSPSMREPSVSNTMGSASMENLSDAGYLAAGRGGASGGGGSDCEDDIEALFSDIDWATANFTELESKWRAELALIEKDNVTALLESSERGQTVLPAVNMAIAEITRVEELVIDYNRRLKLMGQEITQIADINNTLDLQERNQRALSAELTKILGCLDVPDEALRAAGKPDFSTAQAIETSEASAKVIYGVLRTKFDRGIKDVKAVAERLDAFRAVMGGFEDAFLAHLINFLRAPPTLAAGKRKSDKLKPHRLDALNDALKPVSGLIQLLGEMAPQKYMDFRMAYESICKTIVTTEMAEIVEHLKAHNLIHKTPDEKPSFLLSSNRPSSGFDVTKFAPGKDFSSLKAFSTTPLPELGAYDKLLPEQLFEYMLLLSVETSGLLFDTVQAVFFPENPEGCDVRVGQILDNIFSNIQDLLINQVADALVRLDWVSSFALIAVIERRLPEIGPDITAMEISLKTMMDRCSKAALEYTSSQVEAIKESRFSAKKRSGVFPFVSIFPKFVTVLERSVKTSLPSGKARAIVNTAYDNISSAIFGSLTALTVEASQTEDEKDNLNANIMTVQNTFSLMDDLKSMNLPALEPVLKRSKEEFARNLGSYAAFSLPRILGKLPDFFEAIKRLLQTSSAEEVAFHSAYDKTAARRIIATLPSKEVRKAIEAIHDRVLKHFKIGPDGDTLVPLVWNSVAQYVKEKTEEYVKIIFQVYPASDMVLLFSSDDIATFFREYSK